MLAANRALGTGEQVTVDRDGVLVLGTRTGETLRGLGNLRLPPVGWASRPRSWRNRHTVEALPRPRNTAGWLTDYKTPRTHAYPRAAGKRPSREPLMARSPVHTRQIGDTDARRYGLSVSAMGTIRQKRSRSISVTARRARPCPRCRAGGGVRCPGPGQRLRAGHRNEVAEARDWSGDGDLAGVRRLPPSEVQVRRRPEGVRGE